MNQLAKKEESTQIQPAGELAAIVSMVERVAVDPNCDIDKLERMLDMQERILDRNARMAYDSSLAMMQAELPEVEKLTQGHNYKYAKFDQILKAIKPALNKYGFSITHRVKVEDKLIHVTGILSHREGHREETTISLPADSSGSKNAVQAVGSSTEYGRRYTMNSLLGIATKEADTDALGDEPDITDWLSAIEACSTMAELQKTYKEAYTEQKAHKNNILSLTKAKDDKKKELS